MVIMRMIMMMMMMMRINEDEDDDDDADDEDDEESRQGGLLGFPFFPRVCAPKLTESESAPATTQLRIFPLAHMPSLVLTGAPPPLHFAPFTLHTCPCCFCSGPCRPGMKEVRSRSTVSRSSHPRHATDVWAQSLGTWSLLFCFSALSAQTFPGRLQRSIGVALLPSGP